MFSKPRIMFMDELNNSPTERSSDAILTQEKENAQLSARKSYEAFGGKAKKSVQVNNSYYNEKIKSKTPHQSSHKKRVKSSKRCPSKGKRGATVSKYTLKEVRPSLKTYFKKAEFDHLSLTAVVRHCDKLLEVQEQKAVY